MTSQHHQVHQGEKLKNVTEIFIDGVVDIKKSKKLRSQFSTATLALLCYTALQILYNHSMLASTFHKEKETYVAFAQSIKTKPVFNSVELRL